MKTFILAALLISAPLLASAGDGDCQKLAAFQREQDYKTNLDGYALGLLNAKTYAAQNAVADAKYSATMRGCPKEAPSVNPDRS